MDGSVWAFAVIAFVVLLFLILKATRSGTTGTDVPSAAGVGTSATDMSSALRTAVPPKFVVFDLAGCGKRVPEGRKQPRTGKRRTWNQQLADLSKLILTGERGFSATC